jgi:hypothetical protein
VTALDPTVLRARRKSSSAPMARKMAASTSFAHEGFLQLTCRNRGVVLDVRDRIDQPVGLLHTTGHGIATPPTPRSPDVPFFDTSPLILNTQIGQMDNPNAMSTRHDSSSPITVRKDFHVATNTANTAMADPDFISDTFTAGLATASAGAMPTTAISIPQTTTEDTQQGGSPFATSQGSHVSQAEGRLKVRSVSAGRG